jgi:YfiH family protein
VSAGELCFELPCTGRVLFTSREQGNMSSVTGLQAEHAQGARERLRAEIGVRRLARARQVHGAVVNAVGGGDSGERARSFPGPGPADPASEPMHAGDGSQAGQGRAVGADGHVSAAAGVGLMVLTADCLPVALGSSRSRRSAAAAEGARGAVAMLHAGWRGLAAGILQTGVRALRAQGGDGEIVAIVGPGAGVCCYEVGEEVHAAFAGAHRQGRRIDLAAIARDRLRAAGVAEVRVLGLCTICEERFFSHRREGARAGRQAGVAWLGSSELPAEAGSRGSGRGG